MAPTCPSIVIRVARAVVAIATPARLISELAKKLGTSHTWAALKHPGANTTGENPAYPYTSYNVAPESGSNGSPCAGASGPGSIHPLKPDVGDAGVGGRRQSGTPGTAGTAA